MTRAKKGDTVKVHYRGQLRDGRVFDATDAASPLQFTIGEGTTLYSLEDAVIGMAPGESKTVAIPCRQAFGPHRKNMERVLRKDLLPSGIKPKIGQYLRIQLEEKEPAVVKVIGVAGSDVMVDTNHPLAGEDLTFAIDLVEIVTDG
jgi:peptidylprolyl isomerase